MTENSKPEKSGFAPQKPQKLSTEEYIAKRKAEKDSVYKMIDDATAEISNDPAKFREYLDTQSRMDRYTVNNALLIYKQRPDATKLKEFDAWVESGVRVNKGEKTVMILEPSEYTKADGTTGIGYNVKKVFDVSQTNGKRTPAPSVNRDPRSLVAVMLDTAPVNVETAATLPYPDVGAYYDNDRQTLLVKKDVGDSVALCQCVAQELGFAQLAVDSKVYSRSENGFSAMCIGYMLCRKFGVDTKPFAIDRLPTAWKDKEPKEIRSDLSKMRNSYRDIGSRVSDGLYRQKQDRFKAAER